MSNSDDKFYAGIGSRETPNKVLRQMEQIAAILRVKGWTLRSGHAEGADQAFERGAGEAAEICLPWWGFNKDVEIPNAATQMVPVSNTVFEKAKAYHPAWERLSQGGRKLHARNWQIMMGHNDKTPVKFVVCWTPEGLVKGGTAQALRIADDMQIPVYNIFYMFHLSNLKEDWL